MISNEPDTKDEIEIRLQKIKGCRLDIAILKRNFDNFNNQNYITRGDKKLSIKNLTDDIGILEKEMEEYLNVLGEDKIDTPTGEADFKDMPDEWIYDVPRLMAFLRLLPREICKKFIQVTVALQKAVLKKTIINDNPEIFEKSKITILGSKLYIAGEKDNYLVKGVEIKRQKHKFHYKIKSSI